MKVTRKKWAGGRRSITAQALRIGEIGVTQDGRHLLRIWGDAGDALNHYVVLENPRATYDGHCDIALTEILRPGDTVTLECEE